MGVSLYSLIALSVDRLIAITTPLQYAHRVTKRRIRIVNMLIWGCCISVGMLIMVSNAFNLVFDIFTVTNHVIASIALVVLNTAVIRSVHKQALNHQENCHLRKRTCITKCAPSRKSCCSNHLCVGSSFRDLHLPFDNLLFCCCSAARGDGFI